MNRIIKIFALLVSISFLILYTIASLAICRGSHTEWTKGNIHAYGPVGFAGFQIKFKGIDIGDNKNNINKDNLFSLELQNGKRLSSNEMTFDEILKLNPQIIEYKTDDNLTAIYYRVNDCEFYFKNNKLILFKMRCLNNINSREKLGNVKMTYFFRLPMTRKQYNLLFGKPEKTKNFYSL